MDTTKKAWVNGSFLVATIGINALGALGYINGLTQEEISNRFVTLITPSPFTFGIWGVIYSLLVISVIMMIVKKNDAYYQRAVDRITVLFIVSCILNMAWIIAFSYVQIELSVLFIFGFVITLALICQELSQLGNGKHWLLPLSFGIYTGWLFIATVVNTAAMLVKLNWNGFGFADDIWAIIILIIAILLVIVVL
ncbi:MAG: tryptophan-rich sensory protein, partial [Bacillota bacterium]|nr:tryptophan-rich sensory protein [Bacillota bacterium]